MYIVLMLIVFYLQCVACAFGKNLFVKLLPVFTILLAYLGYLVYLLYWYGYSNDMMVWWIAMGTYCVGIPAADLATCSSMPSYTLYKIEENNL